MAFGIKADIIIKYAEMQHNKFIDKENKDEIKELRELCIITDGEFEEK